MTTRLIPCNFVASFKVGDNLTYNSRILCKLVDVNEDGLLNKPIVVQVAGMLEASLSEIIARAQNFNREGVPGISPEDQAEIQARKVDKFYHVINILKKYRVLHNIRDGIYEDLHLLREYRNKIHIQDNIGVPDLPRDEDDLFTDELRLWVIALNLEVLSFLSDRLARPAHIHNQVRPLTVPV